MLALSLNRKVQTECMLMVGNMLESEWEPAANDAGVSFYHVSKITRIDLPSEPRFLLVLHECLDELSLFHSEYLETNPSPDDSQVCQAGL